jgi:hypothetical protein
MSVQGTKANRHGEDNKETVAAILRQSGFVHMALGGKREAALHNIRHASLLVDGIGRYACRIGLCDSIHGLPFKVDFLLWHKQWPEPLGLACRHQHESGTCDQKFEYLYANIHERLPCRCLVILDGEAFGNAIFRRADDWVRRSKGRVARIFRGVSDFRVWATEGFPYPALLQQEFGI